MKRFLIFFLSLFLVVGCSCSGDKASDAVKEYFAKYNNHHGEVLGELDDLVEKENLSATQKENYKDIMKKQYKDLKYEIEEEKYDGEEAVVRTTISVYDLYKVQKEAEEYRNTHQSEFLNDEKKPDSKKFLDYKLEQMQKTDTRVEYTIDFKVIKKDGSWVLDSISTENLEKIHGIYNYQND